MIRQLDISNGYMDRQLDGKKTGKTDGQRDQWTN